MTIPVDIQHIHVDIPHSFFQLRLIINSAVIFKCTQTLFWTTFYKSYITMIEKCVFLHT